MAQVTATIAADGTSQLLTGAGWAIKGYSIQNNASVSCTFTDALGNVITTVTAGGTGTGPVQNQQVLYGQSNGTSNGTIEVVLYDSPQPASSTTAPASGSGRHLVQQTALVAGGQCATAPGLVLPAGAYWLHSVQWALVSTVAAVEYGLIEVFLVGSPAFFAQNARTDGGGGMAFPNAIPFTADGVKGLAGLWIVGGAGAPADGSIELILTLEYERQ